MPTNALRSCLWKDLTSPEIARARDAGALVAIPVGAIEQHGVHLAVDTDARLTTAVTVRAAGRVTALPVLVAPTVALGFSPHHLSHPGTISLRLATYLAVLGDVAASIIDSGFRRVVFVNGHGGNSAPLRAKVTEMVTDGLPVATIDYWSPGESTWAGMLKGGLARAGHACELETALMLALAAPADADRIAHAARDLPPRLTQPWIAPGSSADPISASGAGWPPIFQADDCGYYGAPDAATAEDGARLLEVIVERLAQFFADFATSPLRLGTARDPARPGISPPLGGTPA